MQFNRVDEAHLSTSLEFREMRSIKSKPKHEIYTYGIIAERLMQKCGKNADAIKIWKIIFRATDVPAKLTYIT